jgi:hypothetical protein
LQLLGFLSKIAENLYQLKRHNTMKKLITILAVIAMSGSIYAGCGVKVPVAGKLSAYDAEKKVLTIGEEQVTLAASATIKDADGKDAKIEDLVGKDVEVSTDKHTKKAEEVKAAKA